PAGALSPDRAWPLVGGCGGFRRLLPLAPPPKNRENKAVQSAAPQKRAKPHGTRNSSSWLGEFGLPRGIFPVWVLTVSPLALNALDVARRAILDVGGVGLIGVDVHGQGEVRVHAPQHVAEDQFAVAADAHAHERLVAHAVAEGALRRHVNVAQRADDAAV